MKLFLKAVRCPCFDHPKDERPYSVVLDWYNSEGHYEEQGEEWKYFQTEKEANKFCEDFNKGLTEIY